MLWYKGWLETRFRLLFVLGMLAFVLFMQHSVRSVPPNPSAASKAAVLRLLGTSNAMISLMTSAMLAGAGIVTQPSFQAAKGLHGSTLFTLSLPVSRRRLLAVRAATGWLESVLVIAISCCGFWLGAPVLRMIAGRQEILEYAATLVVCSTALYCVSVFLATFLDDQWRTWGTMMSALALWWLSYRNWLPASIDFVHAVNKNSPLITHTMPWTPMAFSLTLAAAFFLAALKVAQAREY